MAAELVLSEGEPGHLHRQVIFEPELIARASTAG
jgi:DNA-binding LacI/PurR family transcriptional regulator